MASFKENIPLGLAMVACGIYKAVDLAEKKKKKKKNFLLKA